MGGLVQDDLVPGPAMHRERDLVAHGARRQEQRRLLAKQLRHGVLEQVDGGILELLLVADFGLAHEPPHRRRRPGDGVAVEVHRRRGGGHSTPPEAISMRSMRRALSRRGRMVTPTRMATTAPAEISSLGVTPSSSPRWRARSCCATGWASRMMTRARRV